MADGAVAGAAPWAAFVALGDKENQPLASEAAAESPSHRRSPLGAAQPVRPAPSLEKPCCEEAVRPATALSPGRGGSATQLSPGRGALAGQLRSMLLAGGETSRA